MSIGDTNREVLLLVATGLRGDFWVVYEQYSINVPLKSIFSSVFTSTSSSSSGVFALAKPPPWPVWIFHFANKACGGDAERLCVRRKTFALRLLVCGLSPPCRAISQEVVRGMTNSPYPKEVWGNRKETRDSALG